MSTAVVCISPNDVPNEISASLCLASRLKEVRHLHVPNGTSNATKCMKDHSARERDGRGLRGRGEVIFEDLSCSRRRDVGGVLNISRGSVESSGGMRRSSIEASVRGFECILAYSCV